MMTSSSDLTRPTPLTEVDAETLAAGLVAEMIQRWRRGERLMAEDFLTRHPELWEHAAAAAELIYEEVCLRQEYGLEVPVEEGLRRFPQWRPQLEVLFDFQRLLGPRRSEPQFPRTGEILDDFLLLAELGSGANGRVFLASQLSLGDRPVVLKLTARDEQPAREANEHLSLARLQHTHIVPLYSVGDYPARGFRALCMPYFGGATLGQLLEAMQSQPPVRRTGKNLLQALDGRARSASAEPHLPALTLRARTGLQSRQILAGASYVQAVCWIGACLADALQYAHERGLLHLDVKPSNVLLAADGQPMLLDFHLAREPIPLDGAQPTWLGGTAGYMSPEQQAALRAIEQGRSVVLPVDGRSDVYSLGVVLYEALAGTLPVGKSEIRNSKSEGPEVSNFGFRVSDFVPLHLCNSQVSTGLSDLVSKCLAHDPGDRYRHMAALATDLRRHLANLPLWGVRNRSVLERWQKWRRRRPHGVALLAMLLAVVTAVGSAAIGTALHCSQRIEAARTALEEGQAEIDRGDWERALTRLQHGLSLARGVPLKRDLVHELERRLGLAEQKRTAADRADAVNKLHQLTNRIRFLYGSEQFPPGALRALEASCRGFCAGLEPLVRDDLLDLAIFWADLQVRLAPKDGEDEARRKGQEVLAEARTLFGPNPVLDEEGRIHTAAAQIRNPKSEIRNSEKQRGRMASDFGFGISDFQTAATPWEHYALGRFFLKSGDLQRAAAELDRAVLLEPQGLWPNFYQGVCAYRQGRYSAAVAAYSVCIGVAREPAPCFYNRALAFEALGQTEQALRDYDQALRLDPGLADAALNRGMLHYRAKRYDAAITDLQRAFELSADPAVVFFDLALANLARGERAAALDNLRRALSHNPQQPDARKLYDSLQAR